LPDASNKILSKRDEDYLIGLGSSYVADEFLFNVASGSRDD